MTSYPNALKPDSNHRVHMKVYTFKGLFIYLANIDPTLVG